MALTTKDGLRLAAWYVPSRNGAAVVVFPGRRGPLGHARMLVRHGYGVLLLDRRGEGASEGDFNARGWGGEPDLRAAVAYLRTRPDVRDGRIGGRRRPRESSCPTHSPPPDLADLMPRIAPRPVLLIRAVPGHGGEQLNRVYRDAGGATTALWEIQGADHTGGLSTVPAAYEHRVVGFFDRTLCGAGVVSDQPVHGGAP